jgi:hypothetical protein
MMLARFARIIRENILRVGALAARSRTPIFRRFLRIFPNQVLTYFLLAVARASYPYPGASKPLNGRNHTDFLKNIEKFSPTTISGN